MSIIPQSRIPLSFNDEAREEAEERRLEIDEDVIEDVKEKTKKAMFQLYSHHPFWALLIERTPIISTYTVQTAAATNDGRILYNPLWFLELNELQREFILAHEVAHIAFRHHPRLGSRHPKVWNFATDYKINWLLRDDMRQKIDGTTVDPMPEGALYSDSDDIGDLTSEEIYEILLAVNEDSESCMEGPGESQAQASSDEAGDDADSSDSDESGDENGGTGDTADDGSSGDTQNDAQSGGSEGEDESDEAGENSSDASDSSQSNQSSSGSSGGRPDRSSPVPEATPMGKKLRDENRDFAEDARRDAQSQNQSGEGNRPMEGDMLTDEESDQVGQTIDAPGNGEELVRGGKYDRPKDYKDWKRAVSEAKTAAKMYGHLPSNLEKFIDEFAESQVHWTKKFQSTVSQMASREVKEDYSFRVPNRRYTMSDIIMPTQVGERSKGVFCVDTSGSMTIAFNDGVSVMDQAISEVEDIRKTHQIEIYLMNNDAATHRGEWVKPYEDMPSLRGGGGTDFRPIFEHVDETLIEEERHKIEFVCILTDGDGAYPQEAPSDYDVVWVVFGNTEPPFGETIHVKPPRNQ
jgi:predicted metal-dependent peptidase